jgi:ankyrin repeat protein
MAAAGAGNVESMRLLLNKGAAVNAKTEAGSTPLMDAVRSRNLRAVQLLVERGADVNAATKRNGTALAVAASWGAADIAGLLLDKGARVDTKDDRGYTPLMYAAYSESMPDQVVRMLLAKGADPKATGEGETALTLASKRGETEVVRLLKEAEGGNHVQ